MDQHVTLSPILSFYMNKQYMRIVLVEYSSVFNHIGLVPSRLDSELRDLGIDPSLCNWIPVGWKQVVKMGSKISAPLPISTGAP